MFSMLCKWKNYLLCKLPLLLDSRQIVGASKEPPGRKVLRNIPHQAFRTEHSPEAASCWLPWSEPRPKVVVVTSGRTLHPWTLMFWGCPWGRLPWPYTQSSRTCCRPDCRAGPWAGGRRTCSSYCQDTTSQSKCLSEGNSRKHFKQTKGSKGLAPFLFMNSIFILFLLFPC